MKHQKVNTVSVKEETSCRVIGNLVISTSPKEPMKRRWSSQGRRSKSAILQTTGRILAENEELLNPLDGNILIWEIKLGGRLSPEWKEVLNKTIMNPLLLPGREYRALQLRWKNEPNLLSRKLPEMSNTTYQNINSNRRTQRHLCISGRRTVKNHNGGEKLKADIKFSPC